LAIFDNIKFLLPRELEGEAAVFRSEGGNAGQLARSHNMPDPVNEPFGGPFEELDEALERSARELEFLSSIYKQRGHSQEASDIDNTLASINNRTQDSDDI